MNISFHSCHNLNPAQRYSYKCIKFLYVVHWLTCFAGFFEWCIYIYIYIYIYVFYASAGNVHYIFHVLIVYAFMQVMCSVKYAIVIMKIVWLETLWCMRESGKLHSIPLELFELCSLNFCIPGLP
jgi:hypothetical protein